MADAHASGACPDYRDGGSSPLLGTKPLIFLFLHTYGFILMTFCGDILMAMDQHIRITIQDGKIVTCFICLSCLVAMISYTG